MWWGIFRIVVQLLIGLFTCAFIFPFSDTAARQRRVQKWSACLIKICHLDVEYVDAGGLASLVRDGGGEMVVSNHISWLDIYVINSFTPCHFVAKAEIRQWPLIGWLSHRAGTIFIARGKRADVRRIFTDMVARIHGGDRVGFFPEGTTSAQGKMLPFHANLFEAAIHAEVPIQPVAIRYLRQDGKSYESAAEFIGETTFGQSVLRILAVPHVKVQLLILPQLATLGAHRRELAAQAQNSIANALGVPVAGQTHEQTPLQQRAA